MGPGRSVFSCPVTGAPTRSRCGASRAAAFLVFPAAAAGARIVAAGWQQCPEEFNEPGPRHLIPGGEMCERTEGGIAHQGEDGPGVATPSLSQHAVPIFGNDVRAAKRRRRRKSRGHRLRRWRFFAAFVPATVRVPAAGSRRPDPAGLTRSRFLGLSSARLLCPGSDPSAQNLHRRAIQGRAEEGRVPAGFRVFGVFRGQISG